MLLPLLLILITISQDPNWARIRAVVGGRIVNGYSTSDLVLSVIYR